MKLHADASVKRQLVDALLQAGAVVTSQYEVDPTLDDDTVLALANERDAILLTEDKDFGELVFRRRLYSRGVILVRSDVVDADSVAQIKEMVMGALRDAERAFTTVTLTEARRRPIAD